MRLVRLLFSALTLSALVAALSLPLAGQSADPPRVVMISVDGMMPSTYTGTTLKVPTLRALKAAGAWADGVEGVFPTVTYPSHTTLITGVRPAVHGIVDNRILDPEGRANGAWFWYGQAIKVQTLPGVVRARGLTAAAVTWPVTVGMDLDYQVPEFSRSAHPETLSLIGALSRPARLLDLVGSDRGRPIPWPFSDDDRADVASYLIRRFQPQLLLVHLIDLDGAQHSTGPGSPTAAATTERIDGNIATILKALDDTGVRQNTVVAIVSDHGFRPLETQLQPNALFKREGLLTVNDNGAITDWQAYFHSSGGAGFVYLKNPQDAALSARAGQLLEQLRADPANGIDKVWSREQLDAAGAHPEAAWGLSMKTGFYTSTANTTLLQPSTSKGGHGFDPAAPELKASLILSGPGVPAGRALGQVRMTQIAPTLARLMGLGLAPQADEAIDLAR